jgi:hypothetical protein
MASSTIDRLHGAESLQALDACPVSPGGKVVRASKGPGINHKATVLIVKG